MTTASVPSSSPSSSSVVENSNSLIGKLSEESSVLVVGAGGIGCELLKSLALCRFRSIGVIDLDTIEVSNLNRQFLFRREHVSQPKATVACDTIRRLCPSINIEPFHGDVITDSRFDISFYKQYDLIINALDNIQARQHVNRMCLLCSKPLIDSGSTGYNGQATLIFKGRTQCYDCILKPKQQRTYAVCTIRNTPSQPIHCIVWAKFLYNQFFGDNDDPNNEDVTPDTDDPENGSSNDSEIANGNHRVSTRDWIHTELEEFNPIRIFNKLFLDDINYLITMKNLWEKRRQPIPIEYENAYLMNENNQNDYEQSTIPKLNDQRIQTISDYVQMFIESLIELRQRAEKQRQIVLTSKDQPSFLIWDKNDDVDLRFVTASANLRSYIFGINLTSKFDVKSMAGNIIPAVATTNAIVAGITVLQARKILSTLPRLSTDHTLTSIKQLTNVFISTDRKTGAIIQPIALEEPNPECHQCNDLEQPVRVKMNMSLFTLRSLYENLIRKHLKMHKPDVFIDDGSSRILISADDDEEEEDDDDNEKMSKTLDQFKLINGTILSCDEEFDNIDEISNSTSIQHMKVKLMLEHTDTITDKEEYIIVDDQVIKEIKEIKKTLKRKLSEDDDDDDDIEHLDEYQNELNIVKKTKLLSTVANEYNNGPMQTSFAVLVDDQITVQTNGHHEGTDLKINSKQHKSNNEAAFASDDSNNCVILDDDNTNDTNFKTVNNSEQALNITDDVDDDDCCCIDISDS